jgi:hypothetical protein
MKLYHLFFALALLAPTLAHAQALERCGSFQDGPCTISMSSNTLEGTWIAQVANPGAPLMLFEVGTYHANGSYSGANVNPSHTDHKGVWLRIGDRKFAFTFMFFTRDDKGAFNGIIKARGVVTLAEDGQSYDSVVERVVMDTTGKVLQVTPGITGHSVRMELELTGSPQQ